MSQRMTEAEVMAELRSDTPLNRARAAFSSACGRIDQLGRQRTPLAPIEMRRMEFEAVQKIADALGMAAAPDLLAALQDLCDTIDREALDSDDWIGAELSIARAAIAKATQP